MSSLQLTGTCHCGLVNYTVEGEVEAFYCHCEHCMLNCAAPYVAWGRVHEKAFRLTAGSLKTYKSSNAVTWYFCENCGTGIKYRSVESHPDIDFLLATITNGKCPVPAYHVQVQEKLPWVVLNDGIPHYPRWCPSNPD